MHAGFADLNLPHGPDVDSQTQRERLALALRLGYSHVATAHVCDASTLGAADRCRLPRLDAAALSGSAAGGASEAPRQLLLRDDGTPAAQLAQHTRLTVVADEPAHCARLAAAVDVTRTYDVLAVQPTSERAFVSACTTLDVDIVSLDLARRLPFRLRPPVVRAALDRGVVFELCYAPALREPTARRQLFANALAVVRATGGAGVIVSSGALRAFELRAPYDVANLSTLFGLSSAAAKEALASRAHAVLRHADARRAPTAGLRVVPLAAGRGAQSGADDDDWPVPMATEQQAPADEPRARRDEDSAHAAFLAL